jgi:redox-sensitive bicupin YhaK (pirin superfamily)
MKQQVIGAEGWEKTSPFLFLSEDWFGLPGGFEEHPHPGMQTVTIILEGALEHRDHTGAHGLLNAGDVQWMTAGHGVLHSEMPKGPVHTLQLWLNLPAKMKMIPARYQDQRLADTPVRRISGGEIRGPAEQELPASYRGFIYVLEGDAEVGGKALKKGDVGWFEPGEGGLAFKGDFRALLFAGEPIHEPVVAYGPFVMNTRQEIVQAFEDYQAGRLVAQE